MYLFNSNENYPFQKRWVLPSSILEPTCGLTHWTSPAQSSSNSCSNRLCWAILLCTSSCRSGLSSDLTICKVNRQSVWLGQCPWQSVWPRQSPIKLSPYHYHSPLQFLSLSHKIEDWFYVLLSPYNWIKKISWTH